MLDFGQNMAGYVEMKLTAHAGQKICLLCGETLDENGNFTQENFQDRNRHKEGGTAQLLELVCKEGENHYKPSFTIMGFRYAKVETDIDLTGAEFTAHAVYSEMPVTGSFAVRQCRCGSAGEKQCVEARGATSAISPPTAPPASALAGLAIWGCSLKPV